MNLYYKLGFISFLLSFSSYCLSDSDKPNFDNKSSELTMPIVSIDNEQWFGNVRLKLNFFTGQFSVIAATPVEDPNTIPQTNNESIFFDFSKSSEGDVFNKLGDNNIVISAPQGLALTSGNGQETSLSIENFVLNGDVEFKVRMDLTDFRNTIVFWQGVNQIALLEFKDDNISFNEFSAGWQDTAWEGGEEDNEIVITFSSNLAKAFINGRLLSSTNIDFSSLDRVEINGISRESGSEDYIYSISLREF